MAKRKKEENMDDEVEELDEVTEDNLLLDIVEDLPPAPRRGRGPGINIEALQVQLADVSPNWARIQTFPDNAADPERPNRQARSRASTLKKHCEPYSIEVVARRHDVFARYMEEVDA